MSWAMGGPADGFQEGDFCEPITGDCWGEAGGMGFVRSGKASDTLFITCHPGGMWDAWAMSWYSAFLPCLDMTHPIVVRRGNRAAVALHKLRSFISLNYAFGPGFRLMFGL